MDEAGTLFEKLEVEAWKDTKTDGVSGKYKGEANVRIAARNVWKNASTGQEQLSGPLQAWDACRTRFDEIKKPTVHANARFENLIKQCRELVAREDFREALKQLIPARTEHAKGQVMRTVSYLGRERDTNDRELMKHRPGYLKIVAECRKRNSACAKLVPKDLETVPQDAEVLTEYLSRCQRAWEAQDNWGTTLEANIKTVKDSKEKDSDKAAAYLDTIRANHLKVVKAVEERTNKCSATFHAALSANEAKVVPRSEEDPSVQARFVQHLHNRRKWLNLFRIQVEYSIKFYERRKGDAEYAENLTGAQDHQAQTKTEIAKNDTDIRIQTKLLDKALAYQKIHGPNAAQNEEQRLQAGGLKHGWIAVGGNMAGAQGKVQVWVKQDHQGIIIDRIAIKDSIGRFVDPKEPLEVTCMQTLQNCYDAGTMVRLLNWRMDPERLKENPDWGMAYRLYLEYCGRGDLKRVINEYGVHPYDDQPRHDWIPRPFVWFVLESLAKAACVMKNGDLDSKMKDPDWKFIVHGDIKPENIFLGDNTSLDFSHYPQPKLGDFGIAHYDPYHDADHDFEPDDYDADNWRSLGTPHWRAPEQKSKKDGMWLREQPKSAADVWGIGLTIWALIKLRQFPDTVNDWIGMRPGEMRVPSSFTDEEVNFYGERLCSLTRRCLKFTPSARISAEKLLKLVEECIGADAEQDETYGTKDMNIHDPKWVEYFVKTKYDKWARGTVLEQWLEERDRQRVPKHMLVPPRKRKRADSEDYGGREGKDLVAAADQAANDSDGKIIKE